MDCVICKPGNNAAVMCSRANGEPVCKEHFDIDFIIWKEKQKN